MCNWHVAEKATKMFVWTLPEGGDKSTKFLFENRIIISQVLWLNKKQDLALIKVGGLPKSIKLPYGSDDQIEVGDNVYAIGTPDILSLDFFFLGWIDQVEKTLSGI